MIKWYCCSKCKIVDSYAVDEHSGNTTFPKGEFLAHNDYLIVGFGTKEEAEKRLKKELGKGRQDEQNT